MKLVSYLDGEGVRRAGILEGEAVTPLGRDGINATLEDIVTAGLARIGDWQPAGPPLALDCIRFDLPIARPGKIVCVGLNFRDHAAEGGHPIPDYPALFLRTATSLVPHGRPMVRPKVSDRFDYEAELMIVVGKRCRYLSADDALDAVFGYTVFNDGSVRDYQRKSAQWTAGKNFDATGGIGPAVTTADTLPAGAAGLGVRMRVDGELVQNGNTSDMIFPVPEILVTLSECMTLEPGDLIALGTPAGVGFARVPPRWLRPGSVCEVEIDGIGTLVNSITAEV